MLAETSVVKRSRVWYLLPIFFDLIGGIIAHVALRNDDPKTARNCLYLGFILTGLWISFIVILAVIVGTDASLVPIVDSERCIVRYRYCA